MTSEALLRLCDTRHLILCSKWVVALSGDTHFVAVQSDTLISSSFIHEAELRELLHAHAALPEHVVTTTVAKLSEFAGPAQWRITCRECGGDGLARACSVCSGGGYVAHDCSCCGDEHSVVCWLCKGDGRRADPGPGTCPYCDGGTVREPPRGGPCERVVSVAGVTLDARLLARVMDVVRDIAVSPVVTAWPDRTAAATCVLLSGPGWRAAVMSLLRESATEIFEPCPQARKE
jgi:hypothetical protein